METIVVILVIFLLNYLLVNFIASVYVGISNNFLWGLFLFHFIITIGYLLYTLSSRSDSFSYYNTTLITENWTSLFKNGTFYISFISWPLVQVFNLSYLSVMLLFSYIGYVGVLLLYLISFENNHLQWRWNNLTAVELTFLLPNLHFWTSSIGKGSVMVMGIGLFFFGLSRFNKRISFIIAGSFLTYMVRSHVFLAIIVSVLLGVLFTNKGIKNSIRWSIFIVSILLFYSFTDNVLLITDTDSLDITSSTTLTHRASELSHASSGVDIQNYNQFFKFFTFCFRPLFFDGLGILGLVSSFENVICLFMFLVVLKNAFFNWSSWNGYFKICIFIFFIGSLMLAQVSGNLGIAMRQKSQFMPFLFILYAHALTYRRENQPI